MHIKPFLESVAIEFADLLNWAFVQNKVKEYDNKFVFSLILPDDLKALSKHTHLSSGVLLKSDYYSAHIVVKQIAQITSILSNKNIVVQLLIKNTTKYYFNFKVFMHNNDTLGIDVIARPQVNGFYIDVNIKGVLHDESKFSINTDTIPFKGVIRGYANFQERFILYDNAVIESTPEFSILPAGIEQIHGMVVYSVDIKHAYYLQSRGFTLEQVRQLMGV